MKGLIKRFLELLECLGGFFIQIKAHHIHPLRSLDYRGTFSDHGSEIAILMQGPVIEKLAFTLNTLRLYRYQYPNISIVLSTWVGVSTEFREKLALINVKLIENSPPDNKGWSNINLQIVSTSNGLKTLKLMQVEYALKTRTDQRIYAPDDYMGYMKHLVGTNASQPTCPPKLVVSNLNMFVNRPYIVSDMFMFGLLSEMINYWDVPLQKNCEPIGNSDFLSENLSEAYFVNKFIERKNYHVKNSLDDSINFVGSHFCVVDFRVLELFWYKYNHFLIKNSIQSGSSLLYPFSVFNLANKPNSR